MKEPRQGKQIGYLEGVAKGIVVGASDASRYGLGGEKSGWFLRDQGPAIMHVSRTDPEAKLVEILIIGNMCITASYGPLE